MTLEGKRIVVLAGPLFEDIELWYPKLRLEEEGAEVVVAGLGEVPYRGAFWSLMLAGRGRGSAPGLEGAAIYTGIHGLPVRADVRVEDVDAADVDALVIPGGYAPDHFRRSPAVLELVRELDAHGRPIAAICHAGWVLISAGIASGRRLTGLYAIRDDLVNAGAEYVDEAVVVDRNLITSRFPDDLGPFCRAIIAAVAGERETTRSAAST
jgi:protease I